MKHGALFSGSGGFEQAGLLFGIEPVWASEIEPFPIRVTRRQFPQLLHLGDINRIDGAKIEKVDVISGGSPCQDMSIAGRREGLDGGSRSVLFHQFIRIVKEMRDDDRKHGHGPRPRFMLWENVPGAFSSNKGEDFRNVLEETARIADAGISVPRPPGKGKWRNAGCILGDGFSIAWRVLDAQYFGVPQRRKRIFLVADFAGGSAPEILFKRESLSWYPATCSEAREGASKDPEGSSGTSGSRGGGVRAEHRKPSAGWAV